MTPASTSKTPAPWWAIAPTVGFYRIALQRAPQMSNTREGRTCSSVQGLQEAKLLGKARSAMRLDS